MTRMSRSAYAIQWLRSLLFVGQIYLMMPIICLLFAPWALVSLHGARMCCKTYSRWVFWSARWMVGIRTEVRGTPPQGETIVAAKHQSFLDVMMIFTALPTAKFIVKKEIMRTPLIGQYAKRLNCVSVDRGKRGAAIEKMVADVASGVQEAGQLIIYSQGTRIKPGVKAPYKAGVGVLYEQMGHPCAPVATNVGVMWPRKGIMRFPGTAIVEFMPVMDAGMDREEFMAKLEHDVEALSNDLMREAGFDPDGIH